MKPTATRAPTGLEVAAIAVGAVVAVIGLASIWSFADHLLSLSRTDGAPEVSPSSVAYVGGEGLLVVAEVVAVLLFTAVSTATVVLRDHGSETAIAIGGALAKVVWLFASVAASWNPGWYYILDPNGAHQATLYMFAGSIAQAALMVAVAIASARRSALTSG